MKLQDKKKSTGKPVKTTANTDDWKRRMNSVEQDILEGDQEILK